MLANRFITLEGIDSSGKSTYASVISSWLSEQGQSVLLTREPGGTALGECLRDILLSRSMHAETELLLMFAARFEHIQEVILPALKTGHWVICDRFTDATFAYQGGGRLIDHRHISYLSHWLTDDLQPAKTFLFDVEEELAKQRVAHRLLDRFEEESSQFFNRVRSSYIELAKQQPDRFCVVNTGNTPDCVTDHIISALSFYFIQLNE